ncbi:ACP S-malonyltransferase [Haloferula rosea]|uniref:Malonyl CoA-acyl carrier protein transacylase n=1 Tax=Haloferula rosea TaxID=490093 RepID=A0A934RCG5_9BACT|nr:ACP S-malonyltransferase [Haloferula rosea]MBK1826071.1 ACP S-malonyltransferase [Haloferula rosea]
MKDVVLLFSGQGAQKVGMGQDFFESSETARSMFAAADESLGMKLSEVMFEGPADELTRTSRCQPALYLHGLVALELLREKVPGLNPVAAAGLSLGEFTAHAAAGSFSLADGLDLVAKRGGFMEEACEATTGAMAAMIGGDEDAVKALAEACGVDVANFNAPGQIVLSGAVEGIDQAVAAAKEKGIRKAVKLKVAGAYHSRLMQSAQDQLSSELAKVDISKPGIPVVCNFGASVADDPAVIREMLEKQVTGSVRWTESIELLVEQGHTTFIELGPGKVLAGLVGKIAKGVTLLSVEDLPSLEAAAESLS